MPRSAMFSARKWECLHHESTAIGRQRSPCADERAPPRRSTRPRCRQRIGCGSSERRHHDQRCPGTPRGTFANRILVTTNHNFAAGYVHRTGTGTRLIEIKAVEITTFPCPLKSNVTTTDQLFSVQTPNVRPNNAGPANRQDPD